MQYTLLCINLKLNEKKTSMEGHEKNGISYTTKAMKSSMASNKDTKKHCHAVHFLESADL